MGGAIAGDEVDLGVWVRSRRLVVAARQPASALRQAPRPVLFGGALFHPPVSFGWSLQKLTAVASFGDFWSAANGVEILAVTPRCDPLSAYGARADSITESTNAPPETPRGKGRPSPRALVGPLEGGPDIGVRNAESSATPMAGDANRRCGGMRPFSRAGPAGARSRDLHIIGRNGAPTRPPPGRRGGARSPEVPAQPHRPHPRYRREPTPPGGLGERRRYLWPHRVHYLYGAPADEAALPCVFAFEYQD